MAGRKITRVCVCLYDEGVKGRGDDRHNRSKNDKIILSVG